MSTEQTQVDSDVDTRMSAFFGGAPEVAPEPEADTAEPTQQAEEATTEAHEQETPEYEVFDVDGVEYQLPPELKAKVAEWKDGYTRREDYTRKTQEVAELHRQAQTLAEVARQQQSFEKTVEAERTELQQLQYQLAQYKGVDWTNLDTDQYIRLKGQMDNLRERANEVEKTIGGKKSQFEEWANQQKAEIVQTGQKYLQQSIKGWGEEAQKEVVKAAQSMGFSQEELSGVLDARQVHVLWKAAQYDKLQSGKAAVVAAVQKAPPVVKPGASKGPGVVAEQKYTDARKALKKSGSTQDAARALLARGFK